MTRSLLAAAVLFAGCDGGLQKHSGLDALLQVQRGEFLEGRFPSDSGGPSVLATNTLTAILRVGQTNRAFSGSVAANAATVAIGLEGDPGYWLLPVGGSDPNITSALAFDTSLGFSRFLTAGQHTVRVAASDARGQYGAAFPVAFEFVDLNAGSDADLRITLRWDTNADLDLHVVQPDGQELWARKSTGYTPPIVGPIDQAAADAAGTLDFDSNAMCALDGRRQETVRFKANPPSGTYLVRVDAFSLCGQAAARWTVEVVARGETLASASGTALPSDTRFPHERGSGLLATTFTMP